MVGIVTPQENIAERCLASLPTSQSPARCSTFGDHRRASFYARASLGLLWLQALQLPQVSFAAKNRVLAHTASCRSFSGLALACQVPGGPPWDDAFSPTYGRPSVVLTPVESAPLAYFVVIVRLSRCCSVVRCSLEASQA